MSKLANIRTSCVCLIDVSMQREHQVQFAPVHAEPALCLGRPGVSRRVHLLILCAVPCRRASMYHACYFASRHLFQNPNTVVSSIAVATGMSRAHHSRSVSHCSQTNSVVHCRRSRRLSATQFLLRVPCFLHSCCSSASLAASDPRLKRPSAPTLCRTAVCVCFSCSRSY